jgi:hypothetical protein
MGQRRTVLAIVLGMLLVLSLAGYVIYSVAWPNVREGAQVLTPEGERLTRGARRRARRAAVVARTTASALRERLPGDSAGAASAAGSAEADSAAAEQVIDLTRSDVVVLKVEAGVQARADKTQVPPRQQGSPMATPATGVSGTISR